MLEQLRPLNHSMAAPNLSSNPITQRHKRTGNVGLQGILQRLAMAILSSFRIVLEIRRFLLFPWDQVSSMDIGVNLGEGI